ncbi:MAG TPA: hypothetical protein VKB34_17150 [Povalibacter sp.]|nr:hypothetical protein [Povalibacter sp.]
MFKVLGALMAAYTVFAALRGEVYARSGMWGRTIAKADSPRYFWLVICVYAALSVALLTVF